MDLLEMKKAIRLKKWRDRFRRFGTREIPSGIPKTDGPGVLEKLKTLFESKEIHYRLIPHTETFTAPELAASIHVPGRRVAKVVMVRSDGEYIMAVLPSHRQLDTARLARQIGAGRLSLATESELARLCPDCEVGAMPPFGNLYGLRVCLDRSLAKERLIFFPAGSHHEVVEMRYRDFERIVHPEVGDFSIEPVGEAVGF
jgi:Ala-tRNA(Pro) deacylase